MVIISDIFSTSSASARNGNDVSAFLSPCENLWLNLSRWYQGRYFGFGSSRWCLLFKFPSLFKENCYQKGGDWLNILPFVFPSSVKISDAIFNLIHFSANVNRK